jgi:alpha-mannosidase
MRPLKWIPSLLLMLVMANVLRGETNPPGTKPTLYYIPHTHWEGAVFKTREEYLEMGLPNILKALALLKQYPNYKFTLDQVAYFKPLLERYPEEAAAFKKFVAEGRLEIVGGMDVMPDVVKPGGELFVRQMQYGQLYCRKEFGREVSVAWLLDTFGHHPQMPQLLKLAGFKSFWFCRGVPSRNLPSEFFWKGIDGTEIPAFWLPGFYGLFYGPPRQLNEFAKFFEGRFHSLDRHARGNERVGLAGVDVSEPEDYVPPLIEQFNRRTESPFAIRASVPSEFAAVIARRQNVPVLSNSFSPIFQGTYSSRIELKQATRAIERDLLNAEKLGALATLVGGQIDPTMLWRAWEPVLFNQTHDLASGVMTDHVYEDVKAGYDFSKRLADDMIEGYSETLGRHIDTRGEGIPVIVFNPLGWPRTDVAEVELGFAHMNIGQVRLVDDLGQPVPSQIMRPQTYPGGGLKRGTISFVAHEVPALGYAVYRALPRTGKAGNEDRTNEENEGNVIENDFYRVTFDRASGDVTGILDKQLQWEVLAGAGNVISREQDKGDLWELYRGLDGGSFIAMTNRQPVPTQETAELSSGCATATNSLRRGPVFSEFQSTRPFAKGTLMTRARVYNGVRRIDFSTELVNNEKYVRYQVQFPTSVKNGHNVQEIPFGSLERPSGIEFPAQHWVDYSDAQHGVALLNFGLPGNLVTDDTLLLSLVRAHNLGAYGFGGGYEPGMSSETGFELGKTLSFRYALRPHAGDWRQAAVYRDGLEFTHPLMVHKSTVHQGELPGRWGLLEVTPSNVVLTACKPGPDNTTVLRFYEAAGKDTVGARIRLRAKIASAHQANLLEDTEAKLPVIDDGVRFDLHPFEIKTVKLKLGRPKAKEGDKGFRTSADARPLGK